jgi:hypothetical protein
VKLNELQEQSRWLMRHASNVTSQCGEDGIIAKALELLPERNRWCIEFGAWDGRKFSNTYNLISAHGYRGALIEADPDRFRDLQKTHDPQNNVLINAMVGFEESSSLESLLRGHPIPNNVDVLSIDIDGNDYHVWASIRSLRPKLVVIEFNPTIANTVRFIQECRSDLNHSSSAAALVELAKSKGYELIAVTNWNVIFVDSQYYPLFNIPDNSLAVMRDDSGVPHIFMGQDGHVFLSQNDKTGALSFFWHRDAMLWEKDVQGLPARLRKFPDNYTPFERFLYKWWLRLRWRGLI